MIRRILRPLTVCAGLAAAALLALRLTYGGGEPYPDLTTRPLLAESELKSVASYGEPIGNVAVSEDGRLFFTVHPEARPEGPRLLEWVGDSAVPWPDAASQSLFDTVLGVAIDRRGRLWTIDHGRHGSAQPRLLAFDLETGEQVHDYRFGRETAPLGSFLQDLQVDSEGRRVYVADLSFWRRRPAIVVYDVTERFAFRVLDGHPALTPQRWLIRAPAKAMRFYGGLVSLRPGLDGIALDRSDEWLYLGAMAHDGLFRVRTRDLEDPDLDPAELGGRVERVGDKPLSDGLSIDVDDRVYITDIEHSAVHRLDPDGTLSTVVRSPRIRWPDALSFGPDRMLYIADSALPEQMLRPREHIAAQGPYEIFRIEVDVAGIPGQ
jgi:sugar lactone lactonase YvrE